MSPRIQTLFAVWVLSCASQPHPSPSAATDYDVVIRGGSIYDGSGAAPVVGDVALLGSHIAAVGNVAGRGRLEVDATGKAVSPGFINMLSGGYESLIRDGTAQSDLRQGVTTEVTGEGWSYGPLTEDMRKEIAANQRDFFRYDVDWTTLKEGLDKFAARGIAPNLASFVGATTIRRHVIGYENRAPTADELKTMQSLVRQAMEDGALGLGSSLVYAPAFYASTEELIALCKVVAEYDGLYISHLRSEGNRFEQAMEEFLHIAKESGVRAEVYHLKAAGEANWPKLQRAIESLEAARASGVKVSANMYPYTAAQASLGVTMPPWSQEGGHDKWIERLKDPATRKRVVTEMNTPSDEWENFFLLVGSPSRLVPVGFKTESLQGLSGKTLQEIATARGTTPADTIVDLTIEDNNRVQTMYHLMSEENVRRKLATPWISFGSDAAPYNTHSEWAKNHTHPRAYGTFARVLGHYARDEGALTLSEAIRRMTQLPATRLRLAQRGRLAPGYFADVVVFDPAEIVDVATYTDPHRYAVGVEQVFVNGVQVLEGGAPTDKPAGRVLGLGGAAAD